MGLAKIEGGKGTQRVATIAPTDVTVAVFFDGTGNNMFNTQKRLDALKTNPNADADFAADSSYENAFSNVARLSKNYQPKKPFTYGVYVEGMGTLANQSDDLMDGTGLGRGPHGIPARVAEACQKVANLLTAVPLIQGKKIVKTLTVDVFGFSRGAAAARHFIYEITKAGYKSKLHIVSGGEGGPGTTYYTDEYGNETTFSEFPVRGYLGAYCKDNKVQIENIIIRFAGLFDTVASYSNSMILSAALDTSPHDTPKEFTDDTQELKLYAVGRARKAVHLVAADEHRANFPLTNINSTGNRGIQLRFPGVHSDVGGCYENAKKPDHIERLMQVDDFNLDPLTNAINVFNEWRHDKLAEQAAWLIKEGWYKKTELSQHNFYGGGVAATQRCLSGTRPGLPNTYSFIPLSVMCQFALEVDPKTNPIPFNLKALETTYPLTDKNPKNQALLNRIKTRLTDYAFKQGDPVELHFTKPHFEVAGQSLSSAGVDNTYVKKPVVMTPNVVNSNDQDVLDLRHNFLHFSAKYDRVSMRIIPNFPRMVGEKRERLVLPG